MMMRYPGAADEEDGLDGDIRVTICELLLEASCQLSKARRLLVGAGRSLALRRYARLQPIVQVRHMRGLRL